MEKGENLKTRVEEKLEKRKQKTQKRQVYIENVQKRNPAGRSSSKIVYMSRKSVPGKPKRHPEKSIWWQKRNGRNSRASSRAE